LAYEELAVIPHIHSTTRTMMKSRGRVRVAWPIRGPVSVCQVQACIWIGVTKG